jgi:hypothetical protein
MGGTVQGQGAGKIGQDPQLRGLFNNILRDTGPARHALFTQLTEALTTGGVGARIPIIMRAVEAASAAAGQSAQLNREKTAKAGLGGTAFDVNSQLTQDTASKSAIANIGPSVAEGMIAQAPNTINQATGQALTIGQLNQQRQMFNAQVMGGFYENLKGSLESLNPYGGGGGGSTPLASTPAPVQTEASSVPNVNQYPQGSELLTPGGSPESAAVSEGGIGGAGGFF